MTLKTYTLATALAKARKYCAYQERSQQEVRDKLYDLGLHKRDVELGIATLIEEGYINEERFAMVFAGGKFRILQWGKVKIRHALREKKISDYCIRKALAAIDDTGYISMLKKVVSAKSRSSKEKNQLKKKYALVRHAIGKGYESDLVWEVVNEEIPN